MSLDYPFYEELCRRRHPAAWWWIVGDRLYYLGLLPALASVAGAGPALILGLLGAGWHWLLVSLGVLPVGLIVFVTGSSLKQKAYALAERDGITAVDVYNRAGNAATVSEGGSTNGEVVR